MRVSGVLAVALATLVASVSAGALSLVERTSPALAARNCKVMPSRPNTNVRDQIYLIALREKVSDKVLLAMMATAIVESLVNNLDCGDQESHGVFQQKAPGYGWGTVAQTQDVEHATLKFLEVCVIMERQYPNINAGALAMKVQQAEAGDYYTRNLPLARQYLQLAAESTGKGGPRPTATTVPHPSETSTRTTTKTTSGGSTAQPGPTPTSDDTPAVDPKLPVLPVHTLWIPGVDGGAPSVLQKILAPSAVVARVDPILDAGSSSSDRKKAAECVRAEYARPGDSCLTFVARYDIKYSTLRKLNPSIDEECLNLDVHSAWCVEAAEA